jgi:hypothetical protein
MARGLGLDPRVLWKCDNERERWKPPLAQVFEDRYRKRFGRDRPEVIRTIAQVARAAHARKPARKARGTARRAAASLSAAEAYADPHAAPAHADRSSAPAAPPLDLDLVTSTIAAIARELVEVRQQARALGLFTDDRELLACPTCGLMEDVLADGRLITCRAERLGRDTRLRFTEPATPGAPFTCPLCRSRVPIPTTD